MTLVIDLPRAVVFPTLLTEVNAVGPTAYGTVSAYQAALVHDSATVVARSPKT